MEMVKTIDSSLLLSTSQSQSRKTGTDILGKDDFLKILMTQLQNQDPMNPMQDKDFVAQMATFSSLEQMTNMTKSIEQLVSMEKQNNIIAYNSFVGKQITYHKVVESEDPSGNPTITEGNGKVSSIQFNGDSITFILEDGTELEPGNISQVNETTADNHVLQSSMLIGKIVSYLNDKNEEIKTSVESVSFKNGKTMFQLGDGTSITASQITKIE
jgi:flagellar basal-body rod modification protein FlgD